jgi:murein DD-endopeptidase MepM/ murein hydrolase activator NlpD
MPAPVPKPATAGPGKVAIADTKSNYVNVRSGPGTEYDDIGDILSRTTLTYYPGSRTASGWVWVEQYGGAGWVSTSVIDFEDITSTTPSYPPTPYDGKVGIWHWKGQGVPENTIDELAQNFRRNAPNVTQVWVKVGDGNSWQGRFDNSQMAVNGPDSVDLWVNTLAKYGLEFHAWCVLKGEDIDGEADIIIKTCQRPGVKSMIMDVEPYDGYWEAGREPIRPLMTKVRNAIGGSFHIGLGVDPRQWHYNSIFPDEWFPFVNSVHTMCYWTTFKRTVDDVLAETYRIWGKFGRPIIPILQAYAPLDEQLEAHATATKVYGAKGLSWWRYGVIDRWQAVNTAVTPSSTPTDPTEQPPPGTVYGEAKLITPGGEGFRSGTYTGKEEFQKFDGTWGWQVYYKKTEVQTSNVWAEYKTELPSSGFYQISVFVPMRHATSKHARYKIHGIRGTNTEVVVDLNQSIYRNAWVPLGTFDLVKGAPNAGKVFLNDVTGEPDKEIAFDAVRWRQVIVLPEEPTTPDDGGVPDVVDGVHVADGYDSPVGTADQRRADRLWPEGWLDASPYGRLYFVGTAREAYHTGADLNWGKPYEDKGLPAYACASGTVVFAARLSVWGNVIIIKHDPLRSPTGRVMYSRYGHVQDMLVKAGDRVSRGQEVAEIGDAFGTLVPHLHFDLSPTNVLETRPSDWPGKSLTRIQRDYVDPLAFIKSNRPSG